MAGAKGKGKKRNGSIRRRTGTPSWGQVADVARDLVDDVLDPALPAEVSAKALLEVEEGEPPPAGLAGAIAERGSEARAREVADAAWTMQPDSFTAIELAAQTAELDGHFDVGARLREDALRKRDHPRLRLHLAHAYYELHRMADALELLQPLLRDDPEEEVAAGLYENALLEAARHLDGDSGRRRCPCERGKRYDRCCRPKERRAVGRFRDPSPLFELREALKAYSNRPEMAATMRAGLEDWVEEAGAERGDTTRELEEGEVRFLVERTWFVVPVSGAPPGPPGLSGPPSPAGQPGSPDATILQRFAEDPETPPELARRARDWEERARYGLWQLVELRRGPGSVVVDLVTGTTLFASIPPELLDGMARWTVFLGALIPVEGVWRTGAAILRMSPHDGEAMASRLLLGAREGVRELRRARGRRGSAATRGRGSGTRKGAAPGLPSGVPSWLPKPSDFPRIGRGTPAGGIEELRDGPISPAAASLVSTFTATWLPSLFEEAALEAAASLPTVTNTDGDPLMVVTARIQVDDPGSVRQRLLAHPDFEGHEEDDVAWLGREMTRTERETARAELRAYLAERGGEIEEDDGAAQRFTRGTLRFEGGAVSVEVNSVERLDRLMAILEEVGASPRIVSRDVVDPAEMAPGLVGPGGLPGPAGSSGLGSASRGVAPLSVRRLPRRGEAHRSPGGGSLDAARAWQRAWVDEAVPALGGLTPREAAGDLEARPLLESLLRDLEWRWEGARARGSAVPDIDALRVELGMEEWPAPYLEDDPEALEKETPGETRRRWAFPRRRGEVRGIDVSQLDPAVEDDRHLLVLAEHLDLWEAIEGEEAGDLDVGGVRMNPRVHVAMHEAVANQLWEDDPSEVWQTALRLQRLGYDRHEILHMLAGTLAGEIWSALEGGTPYDRDRHVAALAALPGSWEEQRAKASRRVPQTVPTPSPRRTWRPKPVVTRSRHRKRRR